ncbi:MAG: hypothetical protein Cons2KO_02510 [Congregibacter sp.]
MAEDKDKPDLDNADSLSDTESVDLGEEALPSRFVDRDDDTSPVFTDPDYDDDFPGGQPDDGSADDEEDFGSGRSDDADPGYAAFASELEDPLADWPSPDASLEELPEVRQAAERREQLIQVETRSDATAVPDDIPPSAIAQFEDDRSASSGGNSFVDTDQGRDNSANFRVDTEERSNLGGDDEQPSSLDRPATDTDDLAAPAQSSPLQSILPEETDPESPASSDESIVVDEWEEETNESESGFDDGEAFDDEFEAPLDNEDENEADQDFDDEDEEPEDRLEEQLDSESDDDLFDDEDDFEDDLVDDFLNDLDPPDDEDLALDDDSLRDDALSAEFSDDLDIEEERLSAIETSGSGRLSESLDEDLPGDSPRGTASGLAGLARERAESDGAGHNLPIAMIAVVAIALLLLGIGGYGVVKQRGEMQAEIRDLQARLATTITPEEAEAEREEQRRIALENESLAAEIEALNAENSELAAQLQTIEAQLAERQAAAKVQAEAASKAKAQAAAVAARREAEKAAASRAAPQESVSRSSSRGPWFVNFGSYAQRDVAQRWASRLETSSGEVVVQSATAAGKQLYRVRVVGLADQDEAERIATRLERQYQLPRLWVGKN